MRLIDKELYFYSRHVYVKHLWVNESIIFYKGAQFIQFFQFVITGK